MEIRIGYELVYECVQPTPMILTLNVHSSRVADLVYPDHMIFKPSVPVTAYHDSYGNWCSCIVAPQGQITVTADTRLRDSGEADPVVPGARQHQLQELPTASLLFLLGSRYCETDLMSETAWKLFAHTPPGWARVQAVCDFVHNHIRFDYTQARVTRTAHEAFNEKIGVCRDFTHLAITLCRCLNIPARYCTGYLSDIGMPPPYGPMDFAAWFEVYLGDGWHIFDARNNKPYRGRILIARGRDAADVAISTTFGPNTLKSFRVWCDEVGSTGTGTF